MNKMLKPYMLVHVEIPAKNCQGGSRRYIGELMSFPIPAGDARPRWDVSEQSDYLPRIQASGGTIMVRRIPGSAGLLDELPLSWIAGQVRADEKPRYVQYAEVTGFGSFPWDMLRYDNAVPVNFFFTDEYPYFKLVPGLGEKPIVAATQRTSTRTALTEERWRSFMWRIKATRWERIKEGA